MILVTGATGNLGGLVIDFLLKRNIKAHQISALVRNKAKAENLEAKGIDLRFGNYEDYETLVEAFKGIDQLLLVSGSQVKNRFSQHKNVVEAARKSGVKHIVYISFARNPQPHPSPLGELAESHIQTEEAIKKSGMDYTIIQNNLYLDFLPMFIGEEALKTKTIALPAGTGKVSPGLRAEYAEATANILSSKGHKNKIYQFTNSESLDYNAIAAILSDITGKQIDYRSISIEDYSKALFEAGVPEELIQVNASFALAQSQGELDVNSNDLARVLGRTPTSIKTFLTEVYTNK